MNGFTNFVKFLGWSQIPVWIVFVPLGFIILLISKNKDRWIILTLLFFISLPTLYAFSFSNETRYLFPLYPIFSLLSLFFINKFRLEKNKSRIIKSGIIFWLILSSSLFLVWKDIDVKKEIEIFNLIKDISDNKMTVNNFGYESSYTIPAGLEKSPSFPITSNEIKKYTITIVNIPRIDSFGDFKKFSVESGLTHWIIKEKNPHIFLDDIYKNETGYDFLVKEFDSEKNGYTIPLKIFKVDYEKVVDSSKLS
jgi:hypothetical protein